MNFGELIASLAQKAGIKKDDPALVDLLAHAELSKINVKKEVEDALEGNLFNFDAAKANSALAAHFKQGALDPVDKAVERFMDEYKFDDATKAEINSERSSYKKVELFTKKLNEFATKSGTGKVDNKEFVEKINALNQQLAEAKKLAEEGVAKVTSERDQEVLDLLLDNHIGGYKLAGGEIPQNLKVTAAKTALLNALSEKGGVIKREGKSLILQGKEGAKFFNEKNQEMDLKSFVAATLAANNLLVTGDPGNGGNGGAGNGGAGGAGGIKTDAVNVNNEALAEIEAQLKQFGS